MTTVITWRDFDPRLVEDALPTTDCQRLLDYFATSRPRPRSYQGVVDERLRRCDFVPVTDPTLAATAHALADEISVMYGTPVQMVPGQAPLVYRYGTGIGFVTHHDEATPQELARAGDNRQPVVRGDITVTVSLSDPDSYSGGELYFLAPEMEFKPGMGAAVTFPATRRVLHGVRPITAGHRHTLLVRFAVAAGRVP